MQYSVPASAAHPHSACAERATRGFGGAILKGAQGGAEAEVRARIARVSVRIEQPGTAANTRAAATEEPGTRRVDEDGVGRAPRLRRRRDGLRIAAKTCGQYGPHKNYSIKLMLAIYYGRLCFHANIYRVVT